MIPTDAQLRKQIPMATGLVDYFPDALADVAHLSHIGNEQHNPNQPLHWNRDKSSDHDDCLMRHFARRRFRDTDGVRHRTKVAWRALAALQLEIEHDNALAESSKFSSGCGAPDYGHRAKMAPYTASQHPGMAVWLEMRDRD